MNDFTHEKLIQDFIDAKLAIIANSLPQKIYENPKSFTCGHDMGYKQALLDIERFMVDEGIIPDPTEQF